MEGPALSRGPGQVAERPRRRATTAALLLVCLAALSCRPDLLVRLSTVVYRDGSLDRTLEVRGWKDNGELPESDDWLESEVGLSLARPDVWPRVERRPGLLRAEGFFGRATDLPPLLSFRVESDTRADRGQTELWIEDGVVLRRWSYRERHGDPFGPAEAARALDALIELLVEALDQELRRQFGESFDTAPAVAVLHNDGRSLGAALMSVQRRHGAIERWQQRHDMWAEVLTQHGVVVVPRDEDDVDFWDDQLPAILDWLRGRVAASLSTPEAPLGPGDLTFWPAGEDSDERAEELVERVWGGMDELLGLAGEHFTALAGYYASEGSARFRFESRVRLPGTLLETDGTPDGDDVLWFFRAEDLTRGEMILRADSVEPEPDALRRLGARRDFDRAELVRLADLLWQRDPDQQLRDALARAVAAGDLDLLRDENAVPDGYEELAAELADLLDAERAPLPDLR